METEIHIVCSNCLGWGELVAESEDGTEQFEICCPVCEGLGSVPDPDHQVEVASELNDPVSKPSHYDFPIQPIDFIEACQLGFHEANVIKYVSRAKHKGNELQDLMKARFYLDRLISKLEAK